MKIEKQITKDNLFMFKHEAQRFAGELIRMALKEPDAFSPIREKGWPEAFEINTAKAITFFAKQGLDYEWFSDAYDKFFRSNWEYDLLKDAKA